MIEITNSEAIIALISLIFCAGGFYYGMKAELKAIHASIKRLETKQDKYNHLQERVLRLEVKEQAKEEIKNAL